MRMVSGIVLFGISSQSMAQAPVTFQPHLGTVHKFPKDPNFVYGYSNGLPESLDHLSNRLWAVGVCSDDRFHPEMELVSGEFALWASALITAYKTMPYECAPRKESDRILGQLVKRITAPESHLDRWSKLFDQPKLFAESPTSDSTNEDYHSAYMSLFNDRAWMGGAKPFEPLSHLAFAEWLAKGFGDDRYLNEVRTQSAKKRNSIISRGDALLRLFRVSKEIVAIINVSATWVDPLILANPRKLRFVKKDIFPGGDTLFIASSMTADFAAPEFVVSIQSGRKRSIFRRNSVTEFLSLIRSLRVRKMPVTAGGDYYSSDIGVRIRSPFPPMLSRSTTGKECSVRLDSETQVGWGMTPRLQEHQYKNLVSQRSMVPANQIQEDHTNNSYAFAWRNDFGHLWSVSSSRYWTFYGFAKGNGPFSGLPTPLIETWTYYGRP